MQELRGLVAAMRASGELEQMIEASHAQHRVAQAPGSATPAIDPRHRPRKPGQVVGGLAPGSSGAGVLSPQACGGKAGRWVVCTAGWATPPFDPQTGHCCGLQAAAPAVYPPRQPPPASTHCRQVFLQPATPLSQPQWAMPCRAKASLRLAGTAAGTTSRL